MNAKKARALRKLAANRKEYRAMKRIAAMLARSNAQRATALALRKTRVKASHPPTWPRTNDQHKQGRPVIVLRPVRALFAGKWRTADLRAKAAFGNRPKHSLDALVLEA